MDRRFCLIVSNPVWQNLLSIQGYWQSNKTFYPYRVTDNQTKPSIHTGLLTIKQNFLSIVLLTLIVFIVFMYLSYSVSSVNHRWLRYVSLSPVTYRNQPWVTDDGHSVVHRKWKKITWKLYIFDVQTIMYSAKKKRGGKGTKGYLVHTYLWKRSQVAWSTEQEQNSNNFPKCILELFAIVYPTLCNCVL
jgi:hypothetical protein